jgi:ribosomal protein S18 acetylase RimI-like enzyme
MSQTIVERIEPTTFAGVSEFLHEEWAAFDRAQWGESVQWEKTKHLLRAVVGGQTAAVADFHVVGGVAHMSGIIVGRSWRNQGIGAQLMARFEEMARTMGCHKLSLRTAKNSPAIRFYRRLGYEVEAKMVNHYHGLTFFQLVKFLMP